MELSSISLELELGHEAVQPTYNAYEILGGKISPRVRQLGQRRHMQLETFIDGLGGGDTDCSDGET